MMITNKETIIKLSKLLGLKYTGREQDWAIEFADPNKIPLFISAALNENLSIEERQALMSIILASYDEYLTTDSNVDKSIESTMVELLDQDKVHYEELLNYWATWNEQSSDNWFAITPFVRAYLRGHLSN